MNKTISKKDDKIYLLNDKVVKKLFTNGSKASEEFLLLIISKIINIPLAKLKRDFKMVHPQIALNDKNINSEADLVYENNDAYYSIEFNYNNSKSLTVKNFSYVCLLYLRDIKHKNNYKQVKDVFSINIDGFDYFNKNKFIYKSEMIESELLLPRNLGIYYYDINLEYLRKLGYNDIIKEEDLAKKLYMFVCNDQKFLDELYGDDKLMQNFRSEVKKVVSDLDELMYYDREKLLEEARKEESYELGKQEGIQEGIIEGEKVGKLKIAKKMLNRNDSIEDIINLTNLSKEEITSLNEKDC